MSATKFLSILRQRWLVVVVCVLIGGGLAVGDIARSPKVYSTGVEIFVATSGAGDVNQLNSANTFIQARVQSYVNVATSPAVTRPVRQKLGLSLTDSQLAAKISASAPLNKVLIDIHVHDEDPQKAAAIANAVGAQFIVAIQDIESVTTTQSTNSKSTTTITESPVKLTVIHPAQVPQAPISPRKKVLLGLGLLAGLLVGVAYIVARDRLDTRLRSIPEIEDLSGLPVLGSVPLDRDAPNVPNAFRADGYSPRGESFRQLRTNLQFVGVDAPPRIISVTSGSPADGKTSVSMNLAASLAEAGKTVCLIETDLRRPSIGRTLGLPTGAGLTSVLVGAAELDDVLHKLGPGFFVLTSGALPPNPSELLASKHFTALVAEVAERFDYVICDSAPLLPVADGAEVAASMQAVLLVVRSGKTTQAYLADSIEQLDRVGAVTAGIVINMVPVPRKSKRYQYYGTQGQTVDSASLGQVPAAVAAAAVESAGAQARPQSSPVPSAGRPVRPSANSDGVPQRTTGTDPADSSSPSEADAPVEEHGESDGGGEERRQGERRGGQRRELNRPTSDRRTSDRRVADANGQDPASAAVPETAGSESAGSETAGSETEGSETAESEGTAPEGAGTGGQARADARAESEA